MLERAGLVVDGAPEDDCPLNYVSGSVFRRLGRAQLVCGWADHLMIDHLQAIVRAAGCQSPVVDACELLDVLFKSGSVEGSKAGDEGCDACEAALIAAAGAGNEAVIRKLLLMPTECSSESTAIQLSTLPMLQGHTLMRPTLESSANATPTPLLRADCKGGMALVAAASRGHIGVVKLLLRWPQCAPRADCHEGFALIAAAQVRRIERLTRSSN